MQTLRYLRLAHFPPFGRGGPPSGGPCSRLPWFSPDSQKSNSSSTTHLFNFPKDHSPEQHTANRENYSEKGRPCVLSDEKHERATSPYLPTFIFQHTDQKLSVNLCLRDNEPSFPTRSGIVEKVSCSPSISASSYYWCVVIPVCIGDCSVFKLLPDDGPRHERPTAMQLKSRHEKTYQLQLLPQT